jgi:hypothetical protein
MISRGWRVLFQIRIIIIIIMSVVTIWVILKKGR